MSGRQVALAIAGGRVALGLGAMLATERTLTVLGFDPSDAIYVIGKETILVGKGNLVSRLRDRFFALMQRNASSAAQFFGLPTDDVIEVGMQLKL